MKIGGLFGRSPFGPLHEHMTKVQECVEVLPEAVKAFLQRDWERCAQRAAVISRLEHEADKIKSNIRGKLSNSIFSSVERSEILLMLKTQDSVADRCEDTAELLVARRTPFPEFLAPSFVDLISKVRDTASQLLSVLRELNRIYEESADRGAAKRVLEAIERIHVTEHEADLLEDSLLKGMFARESEVDAVTVMLLYHLFHKVGCIADAAENVGDCLRAWIETR